MGKIDLLKNVNLFSKLGESELEIVAEYSTYYDYRKGATIFEEGSLRGELYIVEKGEVVITKALEGGRTLDVARYVSGGSFGELSILDSRPRTATASAAVETTLLAFPERDVAFLELIERHPEIFAQILHKLLAIIAGRIRSTNALISQKSPWVQALRRQLTRDELTGLYNRTFLDEDLAGLLSGNDGETSLLMVKPDNFKAINDTYGHQVGDAVLKLLATAIASSLRSGDYAARYRGNEIVVILPGAAAGLALERAEKLRAMLSSLDLSPAVGGDRVPVTASIGAAIYPRDAETAGELVERAFAAMWVAREAGGDRVLSSEAVNG